MIRMDGLGRSGACAALLAGLWGAPAALALTGGAGPQEMAAEAPWSGVLSLDSGGRLYSGVLIGPEHVLTAVHAVNIAEPGRMSFRSALGGGFVATGTEVHVSPAYTGTTTGNAPGDPSVHADLAIVRLSRPAPKALQVPRIFTGALLGRVITLVSHGGSTTLVTTGENRVDAVFADVTGRPATYLFDFDGPTLESNRIGPPVPANGTLGARREATLVNGDSGSAAFVQVDGQWWLAGLNSFEINFAAGPRARGAHGTGAGGIVLSEHLGWMREVLAAPPKPAAASGAKAVR